MKRGDNMTISEIMAKMKAVYYDECGLEVETGGELEARLLAVASEIYSAFTYNDYIFNEAFPQTATGDYLDCHAENHGISRNTASSATGTLTFTISADAEEAVTIPEGTVCSVDGAPFIQFATDEDVVADVGVTEVSVSATAINTGSRFNAEAGEVDTIVNTVEYVTAVTNAEAFSGGYDDETDESLRGRVLRSFQYENNAVNKPAVEAAVTEINDVTDANVYVDDEGALAVCVRTKSDSLTDDLTAEIEDAVGFATLTGTELNIFVAEAVEFSASVIGTVCSGCDYDEVETAIEEAVTDYCGKEEIGEGIDETAVAMFLGGIDYLKDVVVSLSPSSGGTVVCGSGEYLKLGSVEVYLHE